MRTTTPGRRSSTTRTWTNFLSRPGRSTIQLPAGADRSMLAQLRGCDWWPGGFPGTQTRHMPDEGRCPGGMPRVAAVLGLRRGAGSGSAGGAETILQAVAAKNANAALTTLAE